MCVDGSKKAASSHLLGLSAAPQPQVIDWLDPKSSYIYMHVARAPTKISRQLSLDCVKVCAHAIGRCRSLRPRQPGDACNVCFATPPPMLPSAGDSAFALLQCLSPKPWSLSFAPQLRKRSLACAIIFDVKPVYCPRHVRQSR